MNDFKRITIMKYLRRTSIWSVSKWKWLSLSFYAGIYRGLDAYIFVGAFEAYHEALRLPESAILADILRPFHGEVVIGLCVGHHILD